MKRVNILIVIRLEGKKAELSNTNIAVKERAAGMSFCTYWRSRKNKQLKVKGNFVLAISEHILTFSFYFSLSQHLWQDQHLCYHRYVSSLFLISIEFGKKIYVQQVIQQIVLGGGSKMRCDHDFDQVLCV